MWPRLILESLKRPRNAAAQIVAMEFAPRDLIEAAIAITSAGMVLAYAAVMVNSDTVDPLTASILRMPLLGAVAQLAFMALVIGLTFRVGRMFGGQGDLAGAAKIVIWLNAVMLAIQCVQLVLLVLMPPVAGLVAFITIFWLIWAFASFVGALHDFRNTVLIVAGIFVVLMLVFFALGVVLTLLGVNLQGTS